jgi:pSer/pThr/pTyr-binding forkhead associated (FHA) protein
MSDYIDVKIDVFEHADQRARVLENLTPADLIVEILKEFDDITSDAPEKYAIYLKGVDRPLTSTYTLEQLDIQPHDELVFDYVRQPIRQMLDSKDYAILREETTGKVFDIQWQPAIIGRPDSDAGHNIILAVNVRLFPNGMTVSRKHAQITFSEGHYYVEPLAEHNPVFLNSKEIPLNSRREIKNNDKLAIGRNQITMVFETQRTAGSPMTSPKPQTARQTPAPAPTPAAVPQSDRAPSDGNATILSASGNPLTYLILENSSFKENVGQKLTLIDYPFLVGRSLSFLKDETGISRRHAEITFDAQKKKFYITDLNSTNGVLVDGVCINAGEPVEIRIGSRLGLGQVVVLRFEA